MNNDNRFLRGVSSSGATGGSNTHSHTITGIPGTRNNAQAGTHDDVAHNGDAVTSQSNLPPYYEVVWIMRVKYTAPAEPVDGLMMPVDKLVLLAPYLALTLAVILAVSIQ